jgi:hypothetical protein
MSVVENKNELKGRFWLWVSAISQTQDLLHLASRSFEAKDQENIVGQFKVDNDKFHEFRKTLPDYKEETMNVNHFSMFNSIYKKKFPELVECFSIHDACIELAIVYFCQIMNPGNSDPGNASRNDRSFIDMHLNKIASRALSGEEMLKFNSLCVELKTARDKMLGHADAKAFNINHGEQVSSMKMHRQSWQEIDINFWREILEKLRISTLKYSNEITEGRSFSASFS